MPSALSKSLRYAPCDEFSRNLYIAPGAGVLAVAYNGILLPRGLAQPVNSYTAMGNVITLNFQTGLGDRIDAFTFG